MFGIEHLSRLQRLLLGGIVLLSVDFIWVASSELTQYIFKDLHYNKPFFSTYSKMSLFTVYLIGFLFYKPWLFQCARTQATDDIQAVKEICTNDESDKLLGDPVYVPVKYDDQNSGAESDEYTQTRVVRFSSLSEVRQLSESHAEEAVLARLSYTDAIRQEEYIKRLKNKLTIKQVIKISFIFSMLFFGGNIAYQEALSNSKGAGLVNVLSSTSSLFTVILAAMFPSSSSDKITLTKVVAVLCSIGGVAMVSLTDVDHGSFPLASVWALAGAMMYAIYLVMLKRKVENENKMDIPMFFGFVGVFILLTLWPFFFILDAAGVEEFNWPNKTEWVFLVVNGLVGTVLSELLWLWGCFLTSSLIGTLSLSLTIPLTIIADLILKQDTSRSWMFYVGSLPIFISFFLVCALSHYETWDPVLSLVRRVTHCICRKRLSVRLRGIDWEQKENLLNTNSSDSSPIF